MIEALPSGGAFFVAGTSCARGRLNLLCSTKYIVLTGVLMAEYGWRQRVKGAVGNAFVFAAGWGAAGFAMWLILRTLQVVPPLSMIDGLGMSIRIGFMGFIVGAVFPSIMRIIYRGRRLSEISWIRFGLVGGLVTSLFVLAFMQTMNLVTGELVPFDLIRMDLVYSALFGGLAAALSLKLAQYADRIFPDSFQQHLDRLEKITELTASGRDVPGYSRAGEYSEVPRNQR